MSPVLIIGIAGMFGGLFGSRHISERALALLSREEKLALLDGFSTHRRFASLPLIAVVFMFIGLRYIPDQFLLLGLLGIAGFFAAYLVWQHHYVIRRLHELKIPAQFIEALRRAQWLSRTGWIVFFVAMIISLKK